MSGSIGGVGGNGGNGDMGTGGTGTGYGARGGASASAAATGALALFFEGCSRGQARRAIVEGERGGPATARGATLDAEHAALPTTGMGVTARLSTQ